MDGYATPEAAALSEFPAVAQAHVLEVRREDDDTVRVLVDTVPSHPMDVTVFRDDRGRWTGSSAGSTDPVLDGWV